jgi:hopanoid biosynthesis associated protein HpnK
MKRLIVNADDFGLTAKVNEAIIEGHFRGLISSTSLLANGEAFESAVALSRQAPRLGIGVHWNLTEGKPVAPGSSIPSLTKGRAVFARAPGGLSRAIFLGQVSMADIERELRAQIEKVLAAGVAPTHLDSHKHVHALPALGKIAIKVARDYGIGAIRVVAEGSSALGSLLRRHPGAAATIIRQRLNGCALRLISGGWSRQLDRAGIACASQFYGLTATGFLDEDILGELLSRVRDGTSELMCHPGIVDSALRHTPTRLLDQREVEYRALTQPAMKRLVQDLGIQLVNYRDMIGEMALPISAGEGSNPNQLSA